MSKSKPTYRVKPLTAEDIELPWLSEKSFDYRTRIVLLQRSMKDSYRSFVESVTTLLNHVHDERPIKRITPKREWALAYFIAVNVGPQTIHYLLVLGAHVTTRPKSMAYSEAKDSYDCTNCYYVLCTQQPLPEEKFGKPVGTRKVRNREFHEYDNNSPLVQELVMKFIKLLMVKEKVQG